MYVKYFLLYIHIIASFILELPLSLPSLTLGPSLRPSTHSNPLTLTPHPSPLPFYLSDLPLVSGQLWCPLKLLVMCAVDQSLVRVVLN